MAYYFTVESKKGKYIPLNISTSKYFPCIPRYSKPGACTLQEIDAFTMMFNDEKELRNSLLSEGILPANLSTKPLSSRNFSKGKYTKVMYDFLYQKDIEYVTDPIKVVELIIRRYHENNFTFVKKLATNFSNFYGCTTTGPEVARLAEDSVIMGRRNIHLDDLDENNDNMVARLVKLLILEHYISKEGKIVYKDSVNYRNLHSVIAFINHYDKKIEQEKKEEETKGITSLPEQSNSPPFQKTQRATTKQRSRKKKYVLEGQISFVDLI